MSAEVPPSAQPMSVMVKGACPASGIAAIASSTMGRAPSMTSLAPRVASE